MAVVTPAAVVRRRTPLRAVCSTERSGRTAIDIGSPSSATPRASSTCWKSAALTGCAAAGDAGPTMVATVPAAERTAAAAAAITRVLIGRSHLCRLRRYSDAAFGGRGGG